MTRWTAARAVALIFVACIAATFSTAAFARPHHRSHHAIGHHRVSHHHRHARYRLLRHRVLRTMRRGSRSAGVIVCGDRGCSDRGQPAYRSTSGLVAIASRYLGSGRLAGMPREWCGAFMRLVVRKAGLPDNPRGNLAASWPAYGRRVAGPRVGAIAVMHRRGGGHVGLVAAVDPQGNPVIISGNHGRRVGESVYPRGRIYAYVMP